MPPLLLVTTPRDLETVAASRLRDLDAVEGTEVRPGGFEGLVRVRGDPDVDAVLEIPETEKAIPIDTVLEDPGVGAIAKACAEVAQAVPEGAAFAVRCTRRGAHDYGSMDVEREAGAAVEAARPDLTVDLTRPDVIVRVEVVRDWVGVGLLDPDQVHRKLLDKPSIRDLTTKTTLVQRLYTASSRRGVDRIAAALGRSAQAFEVEELVVAVDRPADAEAVTRFLAGLDDGIGSRHEVQRRSVDRDVDRVPVTVYELYQAARRADADGTVAVMTDPRGVAASEAEGLGRDLVDADRVVVFNGSNRGLPPGLFERADHVLDLAPAVTYGTDQAVTASTIALVGAWSRARA